MLPGFNHNFRHQGILFHVQTEDSGATNPVVVTHIFVGGNIIASRRRSYEKFVNSQGAAEIIETMMKEQHKEMMKDLVAGKFKGALDGVVKVGAELPAQEPSAPSVAQPTIETKKPAILPPTSAPPPLGRRPPVPPPVTAPRPYRKPPIPGSAAGQTPPGAPRTLDSSSGGDKTLDELILEFLEDERKLKP